MSELINKILSIEENEFNNDCANQDYIPKEDTLSNCLLSKNMFK